MAVADPRDILAKNRADAIRLAQEKSLKEARALLSKAQRDLERRIATAEGLGGAGVDSFTATQMRSMLAQVKHVQLELTPKLANVVEANGKTAAANATANIVNYLRAADQMFRGVGVSPLALNEARMFDVAIKGTNASVLRRLVGEGHPGKPGILARYGTSTIESFEKQLQLGLVTKKSFAEMKASLIEQSPFLQGAPSHWAERIVRTEVMGAYNRAGWEATREAGDELGDVVKILAAVFDERTGSDSFAVHGQIRRPDEAFEWWDGLYQHPPNRPNDRETVVAHRVSWRIPRYLQWKDASAISARWRAEKRKGSPPPRPVMTTVPLVQFGKPPPKKEKKADAP